ncbi:DUF4232 domain-containing protein [Actinokineospora iranica]|nr:DUF4232 domain-containing protein [Actinokineospora iranica]
MAVAVALAALGSPVPEISPLEGPCAASALIGSIGGLDPGAGQRQATLRVRNVSSGACTLDGFGTLHLVAADGSRNPTVDVHVGDPGPTLVRLAPGATAGKRLRWSVMPGPGEPVDGPCGPPSAALRVTLPGGAGQEVVPFAFGSVCSGGRIETSAYFPV